MNEILAELKTIEGLLIVLIGLALLWFCIWTGGREP
jgi:hypothetical protein